VQLRRKMDGQFINSNDKKVWRQGGNLGRYHVESEKCQKALC
jgi:hypothetical protein